MYPNTSAETRSERSDAQALLHPNIRKSDFLHSLDIPQGWMGGSFRTARGGYVGKGSRQPP
eukprot:14590550-Alexandrium_andersonii.AAC.1